MTFTEEHLRLLKGWFDEKEARSLSQFPSDFGVITNDDELNRVWRVETSEPVDFATAFLREYQTVTNIPASFDPDELGADVWTVTDPMVDGEPLEGTFRGTKIRIFRQKEDGIEFFYFIQTLAKGWVTTVESEGAVDWSQFRILNAEHFHGGHSKPILHLKHVSPFAAHDICDYINASETFDDISCFNDTLSGTWHRLKVVQEELEDGSHRILVFLTDELNTDLYFKLQTGPNTIKGYYYKWEATEETLATLIEETYFDDSTGALEIPATVTISGTDSDFDGDYIWNESSGEWEKGASYRLYKSGKWYLTDGDTVYEADDNNSDIPPTQFSATLEYPNTITVSGGGEYIGGDTINGAYSRTTDMPGGSFAGSPRWLMDAGGYIFQGAAGPKWAISDADSNMWYVSKEGGLALPPKTTADWELSVAFEPLPTLTYTLESTATATPVFSGTTLQDEVAGRTVDVRRLTRGEDDRLFDVEIEITWDTASEFSGTASITIANGRVTSVTEKGFRASEARVNTKRAEYASLDAGQTGQFDVSERGDGRGFDYVGRILTTTFGSDCVQTADTTTYTGHHIDPTTGAHCKLADDSFVTWTAFKDALGSEMGSARIEWNDDNTISYTVQTTGDLDHSDWTYYKGSEVTERVYIRRNQTESQVDSFITGLSLSATAGQQVDIERVKDDNEKMSVTIRITTVAAKTVDFDVGGTRVATATQMGWGVTPATAAALDAGYSSLPDGTVGRIELRKNPDGTFDYIGVKTTSTSDSDHIALADQTVYYGYHIDPNDTGLVCAYPGGGKTWAAFKEALGSQMGNARIEWNEDGTLNYSVTTSGDLVDSTWVYRVGDTITETVYILRNTTEDAIDAKITEVDDGTAGTVVTVERIKDDQERLSATIRKRVEGGKADDNIVLSGTRQSVTTSQGWGVAEDSADAAKLAGATGTSVTFEKRRREDGLYDYRAVSVATTADSDVIKLADQTVYVGYHINAASGETCRDSDGELVTWAALKIALGSEMGNARITWNEDGTLDYVITTTGDLDDSIWTYYRGDTITEKVIILRNKTDAEIDTALGTTYASELVAAAGKAVSIERVKDDNEKMSVTIRITTEGGKSDFDDLTVAGGRISSVTEQGWGVAEASVPSDYNALGTGVTGKLDVRRREDGLFDYVGIQTTITGDSEYVELVGATVFVGDRIDPDTGTPCSTPDTAGGADKSWTQFKAYIADKGGRAQITLNEDGTVSYVCTLTDSENASMYIRTVRGDGSAQGTYTLYGSKTDCEDVADTLQFDADGELVGSGGSTLEATVAGRTVGKPQISYDKEEGLYRFEVTIEWVAEQTMYDFDRAPTVPDVGSAGKTLPRTGTPIVSQWWETGRNTTKLPSKPNSMYDDTTGKWVELYELQQPVQINERGLYDWVMNCKRIELARSFLDGDDWSSDDAPYAEDDIVYHDYKWWQSGEDANSTEPGGSGWTEIDNPASPKWLLHARQRKSEKKTQVIASDSQQVMRLLNGLVDDPDDSTASISWDSDWDWDDSLTYVDDYVVYHDDKWWQNTSGVTTTAGDEPGVDAAWVETEAAPAGWDAPTNGTWKSTYAKTYVDEFSTNSNGLAWNSNWDDNVGQSSNSDASWDYEDADWNRRFSPSVTSALSGSGWTGAGYVRVQKPASADTTSGTTLTSFMSGLPGNYGIAKLSSSNSQYWSAGDDIIVWYNGNQYVWRVIEKAVDGTSLLVETAGRSGTNISEDDGFAVSGTGAYTPPHHTRSSRAAVVGDRTTPGSLLYENGVSGDDAESISFVTAAATTATDGGPAGIADSTGYPYRAVNFSPINFYINRSDLDNIQQGPRFGYFKDRYSNPKMMEAVRRTRRKVDTEIYRKYCVVHPHMLSSTAAFIPAAFADDDQTWPTDGFWLDSNTLMKFQVSDGAVQMFGAMLYFVECIIEYYGEEEPDRIEDSARDGEGSRNYPQVDPDTGAVMIYYAPTEVSSLYGPNTLLAGQSNREITRYGDVPKLIEYFDIVDP